MNKFQHRKTIFAYLVKLYLDMNSVCQKSVSKVVLCMLNFNYLRVFVSFRVHQFEMDVSENKIIICFIVFILCFTNSEATPMGWSVSVTCTRVGMQVFDNKHTVFVLRILSVDFWLAEYPKFSSYFQGGGGGRGGACFTLQSRVKI